MNDHDDITLRDLYVILRRGLVSIVVVALAVGVVAYVVGSLLPTRYRSVTVMQVTPSPIGAQVIGGLDFNPRTDLSFEAYRSIAFSAPVLEETADRVGAPQGGILALRSQLVLTRLAGPNSPNQIAPLTVEHEVRGNDPESVVQLARAWSDTTLIEVRSAVTASLSAISDSTTQALTLRQMALEESEGALQAFQASDDRGALTRRLTDIDARLTSSLARIDQLEQQIAIGTARQAFLSDQLQALTPDLQVSTDTQLDALADADLITPETANLLRVLLANRPDALVSLEQDLLTLLIRTELQDETSDLVVRLVEHDVVAGALAGLEEQAETLRGQIAALDRTATTLSRAQREAQEAYDSVAEIVPVVDYAADLSSTSIRPLSAPTAPPSVVGWSAALLAVVATILAGLLMVLVTFLREAVRAPPPPPPGGPGSEPSAAEGEA